MIVHTRFSKKFGSWSWTYVDVVFMLIWCDVVQSLEFDLLILSRLDAYAWFEEAKHVMFLKLGSWKKACIFEEASIFEGVLEVEDLEESLDLQRSFNLRRCSWSWRLGRKLVSSKELQSSKMFLKLESWKKACIFKSFNLRGWSTLGVEEASISWENSL